MKHLLAQIRNPVLPDAIGGGPNPKIDVGGAVVGRFVSSLIGILVIIGFLLSIFFLITGAISWISSGGDKNNLENARNRIIHALMGMIILGAVWAIFVLVGQWFGLDVKKLPIPAIGGAGAGSSTTSSVTNTIYCVVSLGLYCP